MSLRAQVVSVLLNYLELEVFSSACLVPLFILYDSLCVLIQ